MALDAALNFAKSTLSTGYTSAATSIVLVSGGGAKFPAAPFNAVWYNSTDYGSPEDDPSVEIVRCTVISTDTLTVTRGQESTSAANHNTAGKTYTLSAGPTAKLITDIPGITLTTAAQTAITSVGTLSGLTVTAAPTFSAVTLGSVLFAGTAGLLSQDNAKLFYDATNHRLGIGTAAPGALLELGVPLTVSTDRAVRIAAMSGGNPYGVEVAGGLDASGQSMGAIRIKNGASTLTPVYVNYLGNVGIGTTAPTSPLQVVTLPTYTSNATAAAGGLTAGAFFKVSVAGEYFVHVVV